LGHGSGKQILCKDCIGAWQQNYQAPAQPPFVAPPPSGPNPPAAAVLGLIPGVGAFYNGQYFKGFIHIVVFAVLISITEHYPLFGLFIAAWIFYQSFEAFHTAKALRDGQTPPDPFGLNEVGNWLNLGARLQPPGQPGAAGPATAGAPPPVEGQPLPANPQTSYSGPHPPWFTPLPLYFYQRKEPIGAIVLIALGLIFLLGEMRFAFPLILIGLGVWLIVRRIGDSQGGSK
jgi:hypothetical protein